MEIITVNELLKICKGLKDNGFGNKKHYKRIKIFNH